MRSANPLEIFAFFSCMCVSVSVGYAQTTPSDAPVRSDAPASTEETEQAGAPPAQQAIDAIRPMHDPLLAPVPAPTRVLQSWREALALIRAQSPDYRSSYDNIRRAEARSRIALAGVLPVINGQGLYTHQFVTQTLVFGEAATTIPKEDVWTLGASLVWPVLNIASYYSLGTASKNVDVSKLDFAEVRRLIAQRVVNTMLSTLATARAAELNRVGLRAALERLSLTETKLRYGQGTSLDRDRAEQDVAAARAQVISGDELLRQAREALGLALGSKTPIAAPGDLDLAEFEKAVVNSCRLNDHIEKRSDVAAARTRLDVARRAANTVMYQFLPSVNVQSQFQYNNQVPFGPKTSWNVQAVLNVPIFEGGARSASLRDLRATEDQARQALTSTRLNALLDFTRAQRAIGVSTASRDVAKNQRDVARRVDERTRESYAHGLGTSLDLVTSAQALRQAEINLVLLEFRVAESRVGATLANAQCIF